MRRWRLIDAPVEFPQISIPGQTPPWKWSVLALCLAGGFIGLWTARAWVPPRPLFHDFLGYPEMGFQLRWYTSSPVSDGHGRLAYVDAHRNLLLVVCDVSEPLKSALPPRDAFEKCVLLRGTPHEIMIEPGRDRFLLFKRGTLTEERPLSPGMAEQIFHDLVRRRSNGELDILSRIHEMQSAEEFRH